MSQTKSNGKIEGSCCCGKVHFSTDHVPSEVASCYCVQCRKLGTDRLLFISVPKSSITWSTPPDVWKSSDFAERGHCATCGSAISMSYGFEPETVGINIGIVDVGFELIPATTYHIFVEEKVPWTSIPDDGARRVEGFGADFRKKIEEWKKANEKPA